MSNSTSKQHWKLKFSIQPSYSQAKADPSIAWARFYLSPNFAARKKIKVMGTPPRLPYQQVNT